MNAYVVATQAAAQDVAAVVDAQQGYPRAGVNVGSGVHVFPPFITQTYFAPIQNPSSLQWAYIADGISTPAVSANAVSLAGQGVVLGAPVTLDATWTPSVALSQAVSA